VRAALELVPGEEAAISDSHDARVPIPMNRRRFLVTAGAASLVSAGILRPSAALASGLPRAGNVGELDATSPGGIDLYLEHRDLLVGGEPGRAITINGSIPGPVIRMQEGEDALIRVHNRLPESTSIHWHGILLPFTMDGVPGISFPGIPPGETFTYRYPVRQNGTYWYHSHTGLQEQLGHYGQLISNPPNRTPSTSTSSTRSSSPTGPSRTRIACCGS
jgi:FtsP/CotA-like multicopper oxidase with cupredoxin domain